MWWRRAVQATWWQDGRPREEITGGSADAQGRRSGRRLQREPRQEGVDSEKRQTNGEVDLLEPPREQGLRWDQASTSSLESDGVWKEL